MSRPGATHPVYRHIVRMLRVLRADHENWLRIVTPYTPAPSESRSAQRIRQIDDLLRRMGAS